MIDIRIMAHPSRKNNVDKILKKLGIEVDKNVSLCYHNQADDFHGIQPEKRGFYQLAKNVRIGLFYKMMLIYVMILLHMQQQLQINIKLTL